MREEKPKTAFQVLKEKTLAAGVGLLSKHEKGAAKLLKCKGEDAAREFMLEHAIHGDVPNLKAPAKCSVVAQSRPFDEWPIVQVSNEIQRYIYGLPANEIPKDIEALKRREGQDAWLARAGIDRKGLHVQALQLILPGAVNRYNGVLKKVENRNLVKHDSFQHRNERRLAKGLPELKAEPDEVATNETGCLVQPPGINPSLYCYQAVSPEPYSSERHPKVRLPPEYQDYSRNPDEPLLTFFKDRRDIPKGQPGYVPEHDRANLNRKKNHRLHQWWSTHNLRPKTPNNPKAKARRTTFAGREEQVNRARAQAALLVVICIQDDWVVLDLLGLLRSVRWRKVAPEGMTLTGLLSLFTGNPVIDTRGNLVTFMFQPEVLGIRSRKPLKGKLSRLKLLDLTKPLDDSKPREVGLVAIDLGQTNPVAAAVSRIGLDGAGALQASLLSRFTLPGDLLTEITALRARSDRLEERIHREAVAQLSPEQRQEVEQHATSVTEHTKRLVCQSLGLNPGALPWNNMGSFTHYISDLYLLQGGDPSIAHFMPGPGPRKKTRFAKIRKGKSRTDEPRKKSDSRWFDDFRPRLSDATRKALNDKEWELKRKDEGFQRNSRSKRDLARRCVNWVVAQTRKLSQCTTIMIVIEDLNVRIMNGKGSRPVGWGFYGSPKNENRWVIQALHKAFAELAPNKGLWVVEACADRTSRTCIACQHCDPESRSGERFCCVACGRTFHADLEIATHNLTQVALTGLPMPKPVRKCSSGAQTPGGARGPNVAETLDNEGTLSNEAQGAAAE